MKLSNVIAAGVLAVGLVGLGLCVRSGLDSFSSRDRVVDVRGLCEREVPANHVTWPIVSKEVGNDLQTLYAKVSATNNTIVTFLKSNGIEDSEISISAPQMVDVQANMYVSQDVRYRYNLTTVVTVSSEKVDKVRQLIARQGELMKEGVAVVQGDYDNRTIYEYTELNSIKPEMIAQATENAREAAKKFAEDSDSKIGKIKSARQGQFSIEDRDPYTPYIKKVRVVTSLTYYLED